MTARWLKTKLLPRLLVFGGFAVITALLVSLVSYRATDSAARQRAAGRAPDRMVAAWITDVNGDGYDYPMAISDKMIAVPGALGVQLMDPATGQLQKTLPVDGRATGVWMSDTILIVETDINTQGRGGPILLGGLEYTTGRPLWSTELRGYDSFADVPEVEVFSGVAVYWKKNHKEEVTALDADTGIQLWSRKIPGSACLSQDSASTRVAPAGGGILAVLTKCDDTTDIFGILATNGSIRWHKKLNQPIGDDLCLDADGPVIMVGSEGWFSLFNLAGEVLLARGETGGHSCAVHATDRGIVMTRNSVMELIDPRNGYSHWQKRDQNLTFGGQLQLDTTGGRIYSSSEPTSGSEFLDQDFLPSFVSSTDLSTGGTVTSSLPTQGILVGTTKNLLIYKTYFGQTVTTRYTAIRPETDGLPNPALAGVNPNDWPDACSFLSPTDLNSLGGFAAFPERKNHQIFGVKLPHPRRCYYVAGRSDSVFSVAVSWVSNDRAALMVLLKTEAATWPRETFRTEKIGDGAFIVIDTTPRGSGHRVSKVFLLSGPFVLSIKVPQNSLGNDEELARKMAKLLLESAPSSNKKSDLSIRFNADAARLVVRNFGYVPDFSPPSVGPLRAITAICATSAAAYCQQVFFFFGQDFVGVGSGEDFEHSAVYRMVKIVGQDGQKVRATYRVYERNDPNCCPSGGQQSQTYRFDGNKLEYQNDNGMWRPAPYDPISPVFG